MPASVPIQYKGFWDVPRVFLARHRGQTNLFDCVFDEALDDYPDAYQVFVVPDVPDKELPGDWTTLKARAFRYLGEVPVNCVQFDPTKRQSMDPAILEELTAGKSAAG